MNPKKQKKENNFPLMAKFLKGNLLFFATALLCSVLSTVCNSLTPQVISVTVDSVLGTEDYTLPAAPRRLPPWTGCGKTPARRFF